MLRDPATKARTDEVPLTAWEITTHLTEGEQTECSFIWGKGAEESYAAPHIQMRLSVLKVSDTVLLAETG